jgi:hypothetical protein
MAIERSTLRAARYLLAPLIALWWANPGVAQSSAGAAPPVIYVVRRGWHIDVGFDVLDLQSPLKSIATNFPGARYVFFGFGDQRYLLAKDRNAPVLLAALWPGRGMMLLTGLTSAPQDAFGADQVVALAVTADQAREAQSFIWQSLDRPGDSTANDSVVNGSPKSYATGPYDGSLYFSAVPNYSAFHTCNTWAAQTLAAAALPIRSGGVIFAGQLWTQVRHLKHKQSADSAPAAQPSSGAASGAAAQPSSLLSRAYGLVLSRADSSRSGTPPSFPSSAARPRSCSSPAAGDCCY